MKKLKLFALALTALFATGVWAEDVVETRTATNDASGMKNAGTYLKAVSIDNNASWSSNKLKIGSNKTSSFVVEINDTYASSYAIKTIVVSWDGSGRPSSFSGNEIAVENNTTWSAGTTTPTKVTFTITAGSSEIKISQLAVTLTPAEGGGEQGGGEQGGGEEPSEETKPASIEELSVISNNYSVYFEDVVTAAAPSGKGINKYIFSVNGNKYDAGKGTDATISKLYCLRVKSTGQDVLAFKVSQACTLVLYADRITDRTPVLNTSVSTTDAITGDVTATNGNKGYATYAIPASGTYYIIGNGSDCYLAGLEFSGFCTDPEATIIANKDIFVGDATDLGFSTNNTNDVVWTVKKGEAAADAADYTLAEGVFTAINDGVYTITATQEADGTHCEVEVGVTLNASQKAKVTSFEIEGATTAHIGEEVTLTAKNFDAAPETISWTLNEEVVSTTTSCTFTPEAAGTYAFTISASNQFNETAATVNHTVVVAVGTDATLSDLKVNGTTVAGFDAATLAYNIGEFGVYEALAVTATATDAPYATAAVVDDKAGKVTITVTAEDKSTKEYVLNYTRAAATALVAISESTTWDWANAGSATAEQKATTLPSNGQEFNFADVLINPTEAFNAAALMGIAQFANRGSYFQGNQVSFRTTVAGKVVVTNSNTGGSRPYRHVEVNGTLSAAGSANQDMKETEAFDVEAGDVVIKFFLPDATKPQTRDGDNVGYTMGRISKIVFTARFGINCNDAENGTVAADKTEAIPGETVTLNVTPATGYKVTAVTVNGEAIAAVEGAYSFTMPAENADVSATFSAIDYTITCNAVGNGSVSAKETANYGETVTLTVTSNEGYKLSTLVVKDAENNNITVSDNKFTMPAANVTVSATFEEDDATALGNTEAEVKAVKRIVNGQLLIEKNGVLYNAQGAVVK